MIVLHSLKVLEQLSEIEAKIASVEKHMKEKGIKIDFEALLVHLIRSSQKK
ncbi:MAG TPA: hypothetical protein VKY27_01905 [Bacteriovoracaceae bacterium]|nr:hypothetical protein [Bacteriovoracaceae bacterium]